jgi:hypothetical protein
MAKKSDRERIEDAQKDRAERIQEILGQSVSWPEIHEGKLKQVHFTIAEIQTQIREQARRLQKEGMPFADHEVDAPTDPRRGGPSDPYWHDRSVLANAGLDVRIVEKNGEPEVVVDLVERSLSPIGVLHAGLAMARREMSGAEIKAEVMRFLGVLEDEATQDIQELRESGLPLSEVARFTSSPRSTVLDRLKREPSLDVRDRPVRRRCLICESPDACSNRASRRCYWQIQASQAGGPRERGRSVGGGYPTWQEDLPAVQPLGEED